MERKDLIKQEFPNSRLEERMEKFLKKNNVTLEEVDVVPIMKCLVKCERQICDVLQSAHMPRVEGYMMITFSNVTVDGIKYVEHELIPPHCNLCEGGNAVRGKNVLLVLRGKNDRTERCSIGKPTKFKLVEGEKDDLPRGNH